MMDKTIWADLVRRYFQAAALLLDPANLRAGSFKRDQAAIRAVAAKERAVAERAQALAEWLTFHRANRVAAPKPDAEKTFAATVAQHALPVLDRLDVTDVPAAFNALRAAVAQAYDPKDDTKRSLLVLTSKLLWCRFPETAPVYDASAANATAFLVKLLKVVEVHAPYERIAEERHYDDHDGYQAWDFNNKKLVDCWYYKDYVQSRAVLYGRCEAEIIRLIAEARSAVMTASPFQVFDKMLWLIGDHRHDYSLKGTGAG
jgi:predicted aminopeptidase